MYLCCLTTIYYLLYLLFVNVIIKVLKLTQWLHILQPKSNCFLMMTRRRWDKTTHAPSSGPDQARCSVERAVFWWSQIVRVSWSLLITSAVNRLIGEVVQSRRRPLLGPSPGGKHILSFSHLRHYQDTMLTKSPLPYDLCVTSQFHIYLPPV